MAENKTTGERLRIEGGTSDDPNSNEALEASVEALRRQIYDIADPEITLEGDQLLVRPIAGTTTDTSTMPAQKQTELADLAPDNIIRLTVIKDQLTAAKDAGVPSRLLPQLKHRLRAA